MGAVHYDAQLVALGDHGPAEPAQPAVHGRFGLHVAYVIDPVVHQGEHGDAGCASFLQSPQVTVQEVTALTAQQHYRATIAGSLVHVGR